MYHNLYSISVALTQNLPYKLNEKNSAKNIASMANFIFPLYPDLNVMGSSSAHYICLTGAFSGKRNTFLETFIQFQKYLAIKSIKNA